MLFDNKKVFSCRVDNPYEMGTPMVRQKDTDLPASVYGLRVIEGAICCRVCSIVIGKIFKFLYKMIKKKKVCGGEKSVS